MVTILQNWDISYAQISTYGGRQCGGGMVTIGGQNAPIGDHFRL